MVKKIGQFFLLIFVFASNLYATDNQLGNFSGRISKVNAEASLLRLRTEFHNLKYLNRKDLVEFWTENNPVLRCKSYVVGRTNNYVLLKVPNFSICGKSINLSSGNFLQCHSSDLIKNINVAQSLVEVLLKKRVAMDGRISKVKRDLDSHIEKVGAINKRYEVLREKLEREWRDELALLEEDKLVSERNYLEYKNRINEIDFKLEKYRIYDDNLKTDRWALDPRLFYKK
jgi:hypothetical protein